MTERYEINHRTRLLGLEEQLKSRINGLEYYIRCRAQREINYTYKKLREIMEITSDSGANISKYKEVIQELAPRLKDFGIEVEL